MDFTGRKKLKVEVVNVSHENEGEKVLKLNKINLGKNKEFKINFL